MAENEPDYIKAIRAQQQRRKGGDARSGGAAGGREGLSLAEREAVKWAREVSGKDPQVNPSLRGAKAAVLFKPASIDGRAPIVLDGVASREALAERLRLAESNGQELLGCYEVTTARPLEVEKKGSDFAFTAGKPRALPKPMSPDQMIRKATAEAEELAKSRKFDDRQPGGRGRGGPGGPGGPGGDRGGRRPGGDRGRSSAGGPGGERRPPASGASGGSAPGSEGGTPQA